MKTQKWLPESERDRLDRLQAALRAVERKNGSPDLIESLKKAISDIFRQKNDENGLRPDEIEKNISLDKHSTPMK